MWIALSSHSFPASSLESKSKVTKLYPKSIADLESALRPSNYALRVLLRPSNYASRALLRPSNYASRALSRPPNYASRALSRPPN